MEPAKVKAVMDWPVLQNVHHVRSFLGLAGYYRRFVRDFSQIAAPLTDLLHKNVAFQWTDKQEKAFKQLKEAVCNAPVLIVPDPGKPYTVVTDASGFAVGAALCQDHGNGLQPSAYISRKMNDHEKNYPVHEQELLAIIHALREWRHYLHGSQFTVVTDHRSLQYIQTQPNLSARQVRWTEFLAQFDFTVQYRAGKENHVADALSRRPDHQVSALEESTVEVTDALLADVREAYLSDSDTKALLEKRSDKYVYRDGMIYTKDSKLYIPNDTKIRTKLLAEAHDIQISGHMGEWKTLKRMKAHFYWPNLQKTVSEYVKSCDLCQRNKGTNQLPRGLLQALEIPDTRWETVTMDLITQLPRTKRGNTAVVVFVDKLSKMVHYAATRTEVTAPELAEIFLDTVVKHHGIPKSIVSDRDSRFTSKFWQCLFEALGTRLRMSTAHHPQTDGQTERANRVLEDVIRNYVNKHHKDWDRYLVAAEIAVNSSVQASTNFTPYYLNYGMNPAFNLDFAVPTISNETAAQVLAKLQQDLETARSNLIDARDRQTHYANVHRREFIFKEGEEVLLSTQYLALKKGLARKLSCKYTGPFKIVDVVSAVAYKLELPANWRVHPVFHISLLKRYNRDESFSRADPTLEVIEIDDSNVVADEIDKIIGQRMDTDGQVQYLVIWKDQEASEATWKYASELADCTAAVQRFQEKVQEDANKASRAVDDIMGEFNRSVQRTEHS